MCLGDAHNFVIDKYGYILVEGQTEEAFVKRMLSPRFDGRLQPIIVKTKRSAMGANRGGGDYKKIVADLGILFRDSGVSVVTTMFDYYGLPVGFPGFKQTTGSDIMEKVRIAEEAFKEDILRHFSYAKHDVFLPYLSLHEFEAMIFCASPEVLKNNLLLSMSDARQLLGVVGDAQFDTPEHINLDLPPSKRLQMAVKKYKKNYNKVSDGIQIIEEITLPIIRAKCQHFNQ